MKYKFFLFVFVLGGAGRLLSQNQPPVLNNLTAVTNWSSQTVTLTYDVSDAENDPLDIRVQVSNTEGNTYTLTGQITATGDLGFPVAPGPGKAINLDFSALTSLTGPFTVRVIADDQQPFDYQSLVDAVDSNRLRNDLMFVQGIRHRISNPAQLATTQDTLRNCFVQAGLYMNEQTFPYQNYTGRNIIGTHRGIQSGEQVVIVDAHYDSVIDAPGADDNGSGTVGVMEIARLLSEYPTRKTVRFIGFDLEEAGLIGSLRYVQSGIPNGEDILGVYNFEMIGYYTETPNTQDVPAGFNQLFPAAYNEIQANQFRGDFLINVGNFNSLAFGQEFENLATQYVPDLKVISIFPPGNSEIAPDLRRSDHARFWDAGHEALMLTDGADFRNDCYHTPMDTLDKLNFTFMSNVVKATLVAAAAKADVVHGDWSTVSFQGVPSATNNLNDPCDMFVRPLNNGTLIFTSSQCPWHEVNFEVFDAKGSLLYHEAIQLSNSPGYTQFIQIPTPLNAGTYMVRLSGDFGSKVQKMLIP